MRLRDAARLMCVCAALLVANGGRSQAALVTNGSLTGPIDNWGVPSGWTIFAGSPDTMDETHNVGLTTNPFGITPSGPSPDGGTWVGMVTTAAGPLYEVFGQSVSGLTPGQSYSISWYAGNFGAAPPSINYTQPNAIAALIDGSVIGVGSVLPLADNWVAESVTFVATSSSHTLSFGVANTGPSYLSIDGIAMAEATSSVPEPTTLVIWSALGGLGMITARRRRMKREILAKPTA